MYINFMTTEDIKFQLIWHSICIDKVNLAKTVAMEIYILYLYKKCIFV